MKKKVQKIITSNSPQNWRAGNKSLPKSLKILKKIISKINKHVRSEYINKRTISYKIIKKKFPKSSKIEKIEKKEFLFLKKKIIKIKDKGKEK